MEYYQLKEMERNQYPYLKNWYDIINPRYLNRRLYSRIPECSIIEISSDEETVFADMLMQPFLMVSREFAEVVRAYDQSIPYRAVVLLDYLNHYNFIYQLPILEQVSEKDRQKEQVLYQWIGGGKNETHIRKDLSESLLRRRAVGMGLEQITWQ